MAGTSKTVDIAAPGKVRSPDQCLSLQSCAACFVSKVEKQVYDVRPCEDQSPTNVERPCVWCMDGSGPP